jgi:hypothetical protein
MSGILIAIHVIVAHALEILKTRSETARFQRSREPVP